ncbi:metal-dependent hydrolase [Solimonas sp. K1W22B-7]|nr:metal-dependent hydrolase [Solimonas sp. K1W22B-7]
MDFEFSAGNTQRHYFAADPARTAFITALSALFPAGESFFVESVRAYRGRITDPLLKAQVSGFIGQEAMHAKEHKSFNAAATEHGYPVDQLDGSVRRLLAVVARLPNAICLAVTVCLEHYTGIFAELLLRDEELQGSFSPETQKLWLWHALEESEHKCVAYDVYQQHVGSYLLRTLVMIPTTLIFFAVVTVFYARIVKREAPRLGWRDHRGLLSYLLGRQGKLRRLVPQYFDFFRPGFHPSQHDTEALLDDWRTRLFGKGGLLAGQRKDKGTE